MKVFLAGYPGSMGGANVECWHTLKLWRQFDIDVHLIPTWGTDVTWEKLTDEIGCTTHHVSPDKLHTLKELKGATVVAMCNDHVLYEFDKFKALGCKMVWVNCMTFINPVEKNCRDAHGPFDAYVYQSIFQHGLIGTNSQRDYLIRGAFDLDHFKFAPRPHQYPEAFFVGRAARPSETKWSSNTWPIYRRIQYENIRALMLGVTPLIHRKLGPAPPWANCLSPQAIDTRDFYPQLHCMLPINGGDKENWPRIGLEAFATGVPVVAQNEWGWKEMVIHGETGFLGNSDCELAHWTATMAYDETLRQRIIKNAYERFQEELANPEAIFKGWQEVFENLSSSSKESVSSRTSKRGASNKDQGDHRRSSQKPSMLNRRLQNPKQEAVL